MKPKFLLYITLFLGLNSCSVNYYLCETESEIKLYDAKYLNRKTIITIPKGTQVVAKGKKDYRIIKYDDYVGWAYLPYLADQNKYNYSGILNVKRKQKSYYENSDRSTGKVYVRGYYRKDGTYVRPHTRKR